MANVSVANTPGLYQINTTNSILTNAQNLYTLLANSSSVGFYLTNANADVAATILRVMRARSLMVDSYHYSPALSACSRAGHWMLAVQLLLDMETYKQEKTRVVYTGAISAFATSGHWQFALLMLEEVRY